MLNKMSEPQRLMLREAAKREDRLVTPPANARAAAVRTLAGRLIDAGWVKEINAHNGAPIWRKDAASGETYALKLTAKGLKAATAMIEATDGESGRLVTSAVKKTGTSARRVARLPRALTPAPEALGGEPSPIQTYAPRPTSKLGRVLDMLAADAGATIGELTAATGWLEHTTRAALTGLRHRGYELSRTRKEGDVASVYRIVSPGEGAPQ
jgi:Protein of unknown function (DUF3489)